MKVAAMAATEEGRGRTGAGGRSSQGRRGGRGEGSRGAGAGRRFTRQLPTDAKDSLLFMFCDVSPFLFLLIFMFAILICAFVFCLRVLFFLSFAIFLFL